MQPHSVPIAIIQLQQIKEKVTCHIATTKTVLKICLSCFLHLVSGTCRSLLQVMTSPAVSIRHGLKKQLPM